MFECLDVYSDKFWINPEYVPNILVMLVVGDWILSCGQSRRFSCMQKKHDMKGTCWFFASGTWHVALIWSHLYRCWLAVCSENFVFAKTIRLVLRVSWDNLRGPWPTFIFKMATWSDEHQLHATSILRWVPGFPGVFCWRIQWFWWD